MFGLDVALRRYLDGLVPASHRTRGNILVRFLGFVLSVRVYGRRLGGRFAKGDFYRIADSSFQNR